jgi:hypothetical protein
VLVDVLDVVPPELLLLLLPHAATTADARTAMMAIETRRDRPPVMILTQCMALSPR